MAAPVVVRVDGVRQLRTALRRAGDDLGDLKDTNTAVAEVAGREAQAEAPRRTGTLAGSVRWSGTKTQAVIRAGSARVPWAGPIHWGWPARHITADPFITEAAAATEPTWLDLYVDRLNQIITRVYGEAHP